jgi:hypothetical protein
LHENSTLTEKPIFSHNEWGGSWQLIDGVLRIKVGNYQTDVIASKDSPIHFAMQFAGDKRDMYFKFIYTV